MAQLDNPTLVTDRTQRFIWLDEVDAVAILHYDHKGYYVGTLRTKKYMGRQHWMELLSKGWMCTIRKRTLDNKDLANIRNCVKIQTALLEESTT